MATMVVVQPVQSFKLEGLLSSSFSGLRLNNNQLCGSSSSSSQIKRWERKDVKPNSLPVVKKLHVKVGDNVKVIGGADKGKISTVTRIYTHNSKVLLKDINLKTKHVKGKAEGEIGQIVQVEAPVHSSNVMLYSKTAKVTSRVGHKVLETGQKVRYLLKTGEIIDSAEEWKKVHKKDKKDTKRP
ncbi:unnamed protein product [Sphagnum troendelagicum]|uniref:KOW domain-containing protein n=1 Tax=Sphagnum troendelagicum TaxID=128251 RepID=A0ABP0UDB5_9BRYO